MKDWRPLELGLLLYPATLLAIGLGWLALGREGRLHLDDLRWAGSFAVLLLLTHVWLSIRLHRADQILLPIGAGLLAVGQLVLARLQPELALRQSIWIAVGTAAMIVASSALPGVSWLKRYRYTLALLGLLLVAATLVFGVDPNRSGARLWLGYGGLYFQPSELLKVLLVVFLAAYLDDYRELLAHSGPRLGPWRLPPLPYLAPLSVMFGISQALLFWQRDLGAALLFFGIFLSMLYAASGRLSYVALGAVLFAAGVLVANAVFPHVAQRAAIWLDPWSQADGAGYQIVQALYALGAGGVLGSGLGRGFPEYIPAVETDFILAAIGEELGLAGTLAVVALYMLFVARGFRIALTARDSFASLLATGLSAVVGIQALVILGGTLRLLPLTGITLPFVSYGGSSVLANFIVLGMLLRVSADRGSVPDAD